LVNFRSVLVRGFPRLEIESPSVGSNRLKAEPVSVEVEEYLIRIGR
jgi:hypothetical protein